MILVTGPATLNHCTHPPRFPLLGTSSLTNACRAAPSGEVADQAATAPACTAPGRQMGMRAHAEIDHLAGENR